MKQCLSLLLILLLAALMTACAAVADPSEAPTEPPTEPAPQLHTIPPAYDGSAEWAMIDAHLTLQTDEFLLADGDDFVGFAFVGSGIVRVHFRFTDEVAAMLSEQDPSLSYFITVDGVKLGDVELSADCSEAILTPDLTRVNLDELANQIRGF